MFIQDSLIEDCDSFITSPASFEFEGGDHVTEQDIYFVRLDLIAAGTPILSVCKRASVHFKAASMVQIGVFSSIVSSSSRMDSKNKYLHGFISPPS